MTARLVMLLTLIAIIHRGGGQGQCPWIGDPGTKTATLYVSEFNGMCNAVDDGFVKASTKYRVHFAATVSGSCQTRGLQCSGLPPICGCVNLQLYLRTIGSTYLYDLVESTTPFRSIAAASNVQSIDTRVPTGTLSTGEEWTPTIEGVHALTSSSGWNTTPCNLSPGTFACNVPFVANVVACKPEWYTAHTHQ